MLYCTSTPAQVIAASEEKVSGSYVGQSPARDDRMNADAIDTHMDGVASALAQAAADAPPSQPAMSGLIAERFAPGTAVRDRNFWIALAVATLLHGSLFIGLIQHQPKAIGEADGRDDGISISVVTESDIRSESSVSEPPPGPPGPPVQAQPPAPPPVPEAKPAEPLPPEPAPPEPEPVKQPEPEPPKPAPEAVKPPELKPSMDVTKEITEDVPDLLALPGDGAAPQKKEAPKSEKPQEKTEAAPPKPKPPQPQQQQAKQQPQKKTAALDLSTPPSAFTGAAGANGRSAGFERPPGITKSGANDAFARAVIRALQGTMPQLRETHGRVTVRIVLNENGNVASVEVVRPSTAASLDQSVVFATKQTSYPFPPPNSNLADRTFLVTYIYR